MMRNNGMVTNTRTCEVNGCERTHEARGYCHSHFAWSHRNGGATPTGPIVKPTTEQRFDAKIDKLPSGHWIWRGSTDGEGRYGSFQFEGRVQRAHRVAWMMFRGPIPTGLKIDHLCRVTLCVNPDHLQPVTLAENILRGNSPTAINAAKTHCIRGHEFNAENTRISNMGGRYCGTCFDSPEAKEARRAKSRRYRARKAAQA